MKLPGMKFGFLVPLWLIAVVCLIPISITHAEDVGYAPPNGFVPDGKTAVSIARAVLIPIYGQTRIEAQKPFLPVLTGDRWIVTGQLPKDLAGGVATVVIDKMTGQIIRVSHGR